MSRRDSRILTSLIAAVLVCASTAATAQARLEVSVFARIPAPGYPANALVVGDGTVYVGTFKSFSAPSDTGPSKLFAYSPQGQLLRTYTVQGQTVGTADAVQVGAVDRQGILYLLDQDPPRVIKLDPRTGRQTTWATFDSVPACGGAVPPSACSDGNGGNPPEPDFAAWGPDGSLYVTDYNQALVWRVPATGGAAKVWFTDPALNGQIVGPAGIELMADRHTWLLSSGGGGLNPLTGKLYTLPIGADGRPGRLSQLWESGLAEAPDGLAIARSGNVYVALVGPSGNAVVEVSPQGRELARVPASPTANNALAIPFDGPGSVTFAGSTLLVANEASLSNDSSHWAILKIAAGEPGLAPSLPPAPPAPPPPRRVSYRLLVRPRRVSPGRAVRFRFTALKRTGAMGRPLARATVRFARHRARTTARGQARIRVVLRGHGRTYRAYLLVGGRRVASARVVTR